MWVPDWLENVLEIVGSWGVDLRWTMERLGWTRVLVWPDWMRWKYKLLGSWCVGLML